MDQQIYYYMDMDLMEVQCHQIFLQQGLSLINRDIIWATAHIRGGMEKGMKWWKEGKLIK